MDEHNPTIQDSAESWSPNMGENPHAEIAPTPPVDFRTEPARWISEKIGESTGYGETWKSADEYAESAYHALLALLDSFKHGDAIRKDVEPISTLLALAKSALTYRIREDPRFVIFGPIVVPTSPRGLLVLKIVRENAEQLCESSSLSMVEAESAFGILLAELKLAGEEPKSGFLESARNTTSASATDNGFRLALSFHMRALASIPKGTTLPPVLLAPALVGSKIEDPIEMISETDMCAEGVADFLSRFGIPFEREDSIYECGECGIEHESDDSEGSIECADSFTLTEDMVAEIETQGFGDALRDYLSCESGCEEIGGLLESCDDSEIRERCAANSEDGIKYDSIVWNFVPDFDEIEGTDSLDSSEAMRAGALLGAIVAEHESAGVLPPIPGILWYRPLGHESSRLGESSAGAIRLAWDPKSGRLETKLGSGLALRFDAQNGSAVLVVRANPRAGGYVAGGRTVPLEASMGALLVRGPLLEAGERAALMLGIHKGSAEI